MPQTSSGGASNITSAQIVDNEIVNADINAAAAIDPTKINGEPYETLADVTLGSAGLTLSSGTIANRAFLRVIAYIPSLASGGRLRLQFNGDTGANYKYSLSSDGAAPSTGDPVTIIYLDTNNVTTFGFVVIDIYNIASITKYVQARTNRNNVLELATGQWNNTSNAITSIQITSDVNLAVGSRMRVMGMN